MITVCPFCNVKLKKVNREMEKDVFEKVMVCPTCDESFLTLKQCEKVSKKVYSRAFMSGNSLAVRIPKKVAEKIKLKNGCRYNLRVRKGKIIIEAVA
jgi:uncharacterized protein with PIN domain